MVTRIVEPTPTAGRLKRVLRMLGRWIGCKSHFNTHTDIPMPQHIADLIGADPKDVVFTSGATESNNMIIKGVARFHKEKKKHVITTQTVGSPNVVVG
jgi:acetylornithine/succinyldiaminopimelate/putrescine aminotransferase